MTAFAILLAAVAVMGTDDTRERVISVLDAELPDLTGARRDELADKIVKAINRRHRRKK